MQDVQTRSPSFRIPRLSFETYAAIGASLVVLTAIVIQKSQSAPTTKPQPQQAAANSEAIETILYQSEARRLLADAVRLSQRRGDRCYQRGSECALALWRKDAITQLEGNYATNPNEALGAYIRLKAIDTVPTLRKSSEAETMERFIEVQRNR